MLLQVTDIMEKHKQMCITGFLHTLKFTTREEFQEDHHPFPLTLLLQSLHHPIMYFNLNIPSQHSYPESAEGSKSTLQTKSFNNNPMQTH